MIAATYDPTDLNIPIELVEAFRSKPSSVVLVIGSGISRRVQRPNGRSFPSWVELLREGFRWATLQGFQFTQEQVSAFNSLLSRSDSKSLVHAAGWLKTLIGDRLLSEFFIDTLGFVPPAPSPTHQLLTQLPARGVVTFNYDYLLEAAFRAPPWAVFTQEDDVKLSQIQRGAGSFFVFKAHGDIGRPSTLVFGHDDYRRIILHNKAYRLVLSTLFEQHVILMLGFGVDDPDVEYLFDEILASFSAPPLRVYALVPRGCINSIFRDIWMRERRLRLIEYEARADDHSNVDRFLAKLVEQVNQSNSHKVSTISRDVDGTTLSAFVLGIRKKLIIAWDRIARHTTNVDDAYSAARERAQVVDEIIKDVLEECARTVNLPAEGLAVIARGGYGMGHLSSSSDIDITLLHTAARKEDSEAMGSLFFRYLRDCMGPVGLKVLPIINTVEECQGHWSYDANSLMSFTFSRLIVGDLNLHIQLREKWRQHVRVVSLSGIVEEVKKKRLLRDIEDTLPEFLNIKTCGGGLLEVMTIHFVEEALRLRGKVGGEESTIDLDDCFGRMLSLRELAFSTTKTLAFARAKGETKRIDIHPGQLSATQCSALSQCRRVVRQRLVSSLLRLVS